MPFSRKRRIPSRRRRTGIRRVSRRRASLRRAHRPVRLSRPVKAHRVRVIRSREFLWGRISLAGTAGAIPSSMAIVYPDNVGGTATTSFTLALAGTNTWNAGTAHSFSLQDLPTAALDFLREFQYFRFKGVTLTFRPKYNLSTPTTVTIDSGGTTGTSHQTGHLRVFFNRQHDVGDNVAPTTVDGILQFDTHAQRVISRDTVIHVKPSLTMPVLSQNAALIAGVPSYNKWIDLSAIQGAAATYPIYDGLQMWLLWENPPVNFGTTNLSTPVEIYATYTVEVKEVAV